MTYCSHIDIRDMILICFDDLKIVKSAIGFKTMQLFPFAHDSFTNTKLFPHFLMNGILNE